jgi:hypothetical protein
MWLVFEAAGEDYFFELTGSETVQQILDVFKADYGMGGNLVLAYGAFALTRPDSRICDVAGLHEMARVTVRDANIGTCVTPTFSVTRAARPFKSPPDVCANIASQQLPRESVPMPPLPRLGGLPPTANAVRPLAGKPHIVRPIARTVAGPRR